MIHPVGMIYGLADTLKLGLTFGKAEYDEGTYP